MTHASQLTAERSPGPAVDFESFYLAHRIGLFRALVVVTRDVLARRLLELPARQRAALILTEYLGHDSADAGRALGIRPGTVRRLASKGRAALRRGHEEGEEA